MWMNPPYASSLIKQFTNKLVNSYEAGEVTAAIVCVNNATETAWFQRLARSAACICFPAARLRFLDPDGVRGAPLQGQAFVYLGDDWEAFHEAFNGFGLVVEVLRVE